MAPPERNVVNDLAEQAGDEQSAGPGDLPNESAGEAEAAATEASELEEGTAHAPAAATDSEGASAEGAPAEGEADDQPESASDGTPDEESDDASEGESDGKPDNPLDAEAEVAADYLEELLDIADLDGDIDTYIEGDRAHVSIVSESEVLVGGQGQVLDALQELTRLAVMTETGERSRLMLDVAGYRDRRRKELVILAADAVQEAKDSQDRVPLAPMNPFERKIVHDAVAAAGLTSESEGEEPRRHVVIVPV